MDAIDLGHLLTIADAGLERERDCSGVAVSELLERLDKVVHEHKVLGLELNLPEALGPLCAICRHLSSLGQANFPHRFQLAAAAALFTGAVVDMANGEGKTLAGALAAALRAKTGLRVHISTFNDYLVRRDATWMWPIYQALGLGVGCLELGADSAFLAKGPKIDDLDPLSVKDAYALPILYAEKTQFGMDFLKDNMVNYPSERRQGRLEFALIDEVDSTLIDEARVSLLISESVGSLDPSALEAQYRRAWDASQSLVREEHYTIDEAARAVDLTDAGRHLCQSRIGADIYRDPQTLWAKLITLCLKARELFQRGHHYQVMEDAVVPIDEETGRLLWGRTFVGGLHQALQLKEGLTFSPETWPLAQITIQNYYRQYRVISGMSGSVWDVRDEIESVYDTPVIRIPTQAAIIRADHIPVVYRTRRERNLAAASEAAEIVPEGRPVLIGVEDEPIAEEIEQELKREGISPQILTASNDELEAEKIANAGRPKTVTITAKLAGRGTDIKVDDEAVRAGGLHVIVVGLQDLRHENQLRGRAGRRGLPGSSSCYVSLHDELMTQLNPRWVPKFMLWLGMEEGVSIDNRLVADRIENAREVARRHDLRARMNLYRADTVIDKYRRFIYGVRASALDGRMDLVPMLNTFADNLVLRLWSQARTTRSLGSKLDETTITVIENLVRLLVGTTVDDFEDVGQAHKARERARAICARVEEILRARGEAVCRLLACDGQPTGQSPADLVIRAIIRDSIDQAWGQFLRTYGQILDSASVRGITPAEMGTWFTEQTASHFQKTLADVEASALSQWTRVSNDHDLLRQVVLGQLREYERWDDSIALLSNWAGQASEMAAELYRQAACIAELRLEDLTRARELYDRALDGALASDSRDEIWSIAAEALELRARCGDEAGFRSTKDRVMKRDPAFANLSRLIQELARISALAREPQQAACTFDSQPTEEATLWETNLPETGSLSGVVRRMLREALRVLSESKDQGGAAKLLTRFQEPLKYWAGELAMAKCVLQSFGDCERLSDLVRQLDSGEMVNITEVLSRFCAPAAPGNPANGASRS